jgi:hypothetical protein
LARINVEDGLWADPRFLKLCIKLGDEEKALGRVVIAWRFAQKFWCPNKDPIPDEAWTAARLGNELVEVGLARFENGGYYLAGSEEQFAWWFQRQESGRKGGQASAKRRLSLAKRKSAGAQQIQPSSSSSSSFSLSSSSSSSEVIAPEAQSPKGTTAVWEEYRFAYSERYGVPPIRNLEFNVAAKQLVGKIGAEEAPQVAAHFVRSNNSYYVQRGHNLQCAVADAQKLRTEWATGNQITTTQARQIDQQQSNANAFEIAAQNIAGRRS